MGTHNLSKAIKIKFKVELAAIIIVAALWPTNVSAVPKWECTSVGGWSMAIDGRRTSIPISDVATVLELSAPDKMRVLNVGIFV